MQQLDRRRGGVGERRVVVAARLRHREAELRTDARAAGKDGVPDRRREPRRAAGAVAACETARFERTLDPRR